MTHPDAAPPLFTFDFVVLTLAAAFAFATIAVFYGFAAYLERLGVDPAWRGALLAAEPLAAFCLRPYLSVAVTPRNALTLARVSLAGLGLSLCGYPLAGGLAALAAVRLAHGACFVVLVSAVTALLTQVIPKALAGRAFGYFSLSALAPYAVMPPLAEWLLGRLGREDLVYGWCGALALPALALLAPLGRRLGRRVLADAPGTGRPSWAAVRATLGRGDVRRLLGATFCLFMTTTLLYFYIKPFARHIALGDAGLFFTVSTGVSIAVRVFAGPVYDRFPRETAFAAALFALCACVAGFSLVSGPGGLLALSGGYGLCLGVAMPLANAVMFGRCEPAMRATALNLSLFMMDAAYVFGPLAGGAVLAAGAGWSALFGLAALAALTAGGLVAPLARAAWRQR